MIVVQGKNADIRDALRSTAVRQWEVCERLHVSEAAFSRALRHELSPAEKDKILGVINEIAAEREEALGK